MINPSYPDSNADYYNYYRTDLTKLIPDGPNMVMDLGCASGQLGRSLLELNKARHLVGVELFEPAAKEARKYYDVVYVADIDTLRLDYDKDFDVVICGDILEHLKEPLSILRQIHAWLKNDGLIICSVPNIRYWRILKDLVLKGEWKYEASGILDHTHLRFFTVRSFKRLLAEACFKVVNETMLYVDYGKKMALKRMSMGLLDEFYAYQLLLSARKV
jgi:O-antigen biosynthesis protein